MQQSITISDIELYPVRQPTDHRGSIVIRVRTRSDLSGWGEVPQQPDPTSAARAVTAARSALLGMNATALVSVESTLSELRGKVPAAVRSGINMALYDLIGQLSEAPAHEILGGPTRNMARALTPLHGRSDDQLIESLDRCVELGFRTVSVPLAQPTKPSRGTPFNRGVRQTLERLRNRHSEVDFVLDCGGQLTPSEATSLGKQLESYHLLWMDQPCRGIQHAALAGVAAETSTPLGFELATAADYQDLLRHDAVDVVRPGIGDWGIMALRKVAALAETYYVAVVPRNAGGPIATAASLQLAAAIPNLFAVEIPSPTSEDDQRMRRELAGGHLEVVEDGFVRVPTSPGLGLQVDVDALDRYRLEV